MEAEQGERLRQTQRQTQIHRAIKSQRDERREGRERQGKKSARISYNLLTTLIFTVPKVNKPLLAKRHL